MKLDGKFMCRVAGTLTVICLVVAALLGWVNALTASKIDAIHRASTEAALRAVAPNAQDFLPLTLTDALIGAASANGAKLTEGYEVREDALNAGYAFKLVASGSQGNIELIVGVDADGAVTGVSIVNHKETAGIGSKVMENSALPSGMGVLDQFVGLSGAGSLAVGRNVDAVSGATVSSKGVTKAVNAALAAAEALM